MDRIKAVPYVTSIHSRRGRAKASRVADIAVEHDVYYVNAMYADGNSFTSMLKIGTTAEDLIQAVFVKSCIGSIFRP